MKLEISSRWLGSLVTKTFNFISSPGGTTWANEPLVDNGGEKEEMLVKSTTNKTPCIFCASDCPSTFTVKDGTVIRLNGVECTIGDDKILKGKRLLSMYIVRNILNVSKGVCSKLLSYFGGDCHPELWVTMCPSCKTLVDKCGQTEMEIKRLETKVKDMKAKLKSLVRESSEIWDENEGEVEDGPLTVWKQIREDATRGDEIKNMEETDDDDEEADEELKNLHELVFNNRPTLKRRSNAQRRQDVKKMRLESRPDLTHVKKMDETLSTSPKGIILYKCDQDGCTALIPGSKLKIRAHKQLHQPNSKGQRCTKCGWLVRYMKAHIKTWHSKETSIVSPKNKIIKPISQWGKVDPRILRYTDSTHHNYLSCRQFGKSIFKCRHCPGLSFKERKFIEEHSKLHDEGGGEICGSCGWLIAEGKMQWHKAKRHNRNSFIEPVEPIAKVADENEPEAEPLANQSLAQVVATPTLVFPRSFHTCKGCGEGFKTKKRMQSHQCENKEECEEDLSSTGRVDDVRVKPFICYPCDMSFWKKSGLQSHKMSKIHNLKTQKDKVNENESEATTEDLDDRDAELNSSSVGGETPTRRRVSKGINLTAKFVTLEY